MFFEFLDYNDGLVRCHMSFKNEFNKFNDKGFQLLNSTVNNFLI